jgi:hypothetical protein
MALSLIRLDRQIHLGLFRPETPHAFFQLQMPSMVQPAGVVTASFKEPDSRRSQRGSLDFWVTALP